MRLAALALFVIVMASPAAASTIAVDFMPSLYQIDFGAQYTINNYTLSVDAGATGGTWLLFATNDQQTFSVIDSRNITFGAGVQQNFNVTNTNAYRYYYLYLGA